MTDALLLPSAILVPDELRLDLGKIPTGMIPLHGKPALQHISESYQNVSPYVVCDRRANLIKDYISREETGWNVIEVASTSSLGDTVSQGVDRLLEDRDFDEDEQLYVNFSDTIIVPNQPPGVSNFVSYAVEQNPIRWTCFEGTDRIESIIPKGDPTATGTYQVFTGLFRFVEPESYAAALDEALDEEGSGPDPFYRALNSYLETRECEFIRADEWIDVGHLDTYHRAKKQFLNVRNFNSISTDDQRNRLAKSSENAERLRSEYEWYMNLPRDLEPFAPTIYGYDEEGPSLELEYIGYPSLRDLHLHGSHGLYIWNRVFIELFSMLDTFGQYRTTRLIQESLEAMYIDKTSRRLSRVDPDGPFAPFFENEVQINGANYDGLPTLLDDLERSLRGTGLFNVDEFTAIHGDLCFSNILFDLRNGIVKLIDPRGEFGPHIFHGDQRYDLAKLRHSIVGNYDFIINDMFDVVTSGATGSVKYRVHASSVHEERRRLFDRLLEQKYPEWFEDVRLIESLLFLSMTPLHDDSPQRQQYMLARGIEQFNQVIHE